MDSSASAILCGGIYELNSYQKSPRLKEFANSALATLCGADYFDCDIQKPGILKKQNGQMTYTVYGDYFLIEALQKRLFDLKSFW